MIISGISKIYDPEPAMNSIKQVFFYNNEINETLIAFVSCLELGLGFMMLFKVATRVILIFVSSVFFLFLLFSVYGTILRASADCGCFGQLVKTNFGTFMVARNFLLFFISVVLLLKSRFIEKNNPGSFKKRVLERK